MASVPKIRVVAGIVYNSRGHFLLSSRPEGKPYAGFWEFAGGKVEAGESGLAALRREFAEELGIGIRRATPWLARVHAYEHAEVHLRFWRVAAADWSGSVCPREGQEFIWCDSANMPDLPMLPANAPVMAALRVPTRFSGSLNGVLSAENYTVAHHPADADRHDAVWLDLPQLNALGRLPKAASVWIRVKSANEVRLAADADVLLFAASDEERAREVLRLLAEGIGVPLIVVSDAALCRRFGAHWLSAGAHTVLLEGEPPPASTHTAQAA